MFFFFYSTRRGGPPPPPPPRRAHAAEYFILRSVFRGELALAPSQSQEGFFTSKKAPSKKKMRNRSPTALSQLSGGAFQKSRQKGGSFYENCCHQKPEIPFPNPAVLFQDQKGRTSLTFNLHNKNRSGTAPVFAAGISPLDLVLLFKDGRTLWFIYDIMSIAKPCMSVTASI